MRWLFLVALVGCGRLRFDALADGDGGTDDGSTADARPDASPATAWVKYVSTASPSTFVKRVAIGPNHDVAITGESTGDVMVDSFMHPAVGPLDMFVASFSPDGTRAWSAVHGGSNAVDGRDIGIDASGLIVVHGLNTGTAMFGSFPQSAGTGQDVVTVTHAPDGMVQSLTAYVSTGANAQGRGLGVSPGGQIVTSGSFEGGVTVGPMTFPDQPGMASYVARQTAPAWQRMYSAATRVAANDADIGSENDTACVGGDFAGATSFAGTMVTPYALFDGFMVKHGPAGVVESVVRIGGPGNDSVDAVVEAADGDCIVVGTADFGTINFDATTQRTGAGMWDGFVARYSPTGQLRWAHMFGGGEDDEATGVDEAADGTIYVTGWFTTQANILGSILTAVGGIDSFVLVLTAGGQFANVYWVPGSGSEYATSIAVDAERRGFVIGGEYSQGTNIQNVVAPSSVGGFVAMVPFQ